MRDAVSQIEADAYAAAKANGMQVVELSEKELDAWKAVSQPVYDSYLKATGDLGKKIIDAAAGN